MCFTDQLICKYYNCTDDDHCVQGYEVCSENPILASDNHLVCVAVLNGNTTSELGVTWKGCFSDESGYCSNACVLNEYPTNYYSCCCNSTLCNNNISFIAPSNYTVIPTGVAIPHISERFSVPSYFY